MLVDILFNVCLLCCCIFGLVNVFIYDLFIHIWNMSNSALLIVEGTPPPHIVRFLLSYQKWPYKQESSENTRGGNVPKSQIIRREQKLSVKKYYIIY